MEAHERRTLPKGWEYKRLIDALLTLENGSRPKGGVDNISEGVPSIGGEHLNKDGGFIFENIKFIPTEFYENKKRGRIENGDVLVVKDGATTGKVSLVRDDYPYQESAVNEHVFICRPNRKYVLPEYLFYNLFSPLGQNKILRSFHGAAQGGINTQFANDYEIPLPPLPTQRRIVSILEKAGETTRLRAQADELTDRLLQSVFREMFGDLRINEKGWDKKTLGECLEIPLNSGWSPICTDEIRGFPVLSLANLSDNGLSDVITKYYQGDKPSKGFDLEIGDILISRSNTRELVGRAGMFKGVPEKVIYPDLLIRIRVNRTILNPVFFEKYLQTNSIKKILHALAHGSSGSMVKISQENLMNLSIITPPIFLQQKFARIVEKVESMRQSQNQSKQQIDDLSSALMQKAFRGEI